MADIGGGRGAAHDAARRRPCRGAHVTVVLDRVPAHVYVEYIEHLDSLVNEFRIIAAGHRTGTVPVDTDIAEVVDTVLTAFAGAKDDSYLAARQALERGAGTVTLQLDIPLEAAEAAERLLDAIERAEAMAQADGLLTLPASPAVLRFARWGLPEVARQLRGAAPSSFEAAGP